MKNSTPSDVPSIGSRIRSLRMERGVRQAELAASLGISASYLNLIEHDRRRIGDDMLGDIAKSLGVEPSALASEVDPGDIDRLLASAARFEAEVELAKAGDFATRFPGWAGLVGRQSDRILELESRVEELTDRMAYDPTLSSSLHEVISAATAIRSTASILNSEDMLDSDWQQRFHKNLHADAIRLAESSDALMLYLEAPEEGETAGSPMQEAEDLLDAHGFYFPELEEKRSTVAKLIKGFGVSGGVAEVLKGYLEAYMRDAATLPMAEFESAAVDAGYDPFGLAERFDLPLQAILRRLASLPPKGGHPPIGLIRCDAAGVLRLSKHLPGIVFPKSGACPLWPLYTSLGQPGRPVLAEVLLPGMPETRVRCVAVAEQAWQGFGRAPEVSAMMLVMPNAPQSGLVPEPIGPTCRICPRAACSARREPAALRDNSV